MVLITSDCKWCYQGSFKLFIFFLRKDFAHTRSTKKHQKHKALQANSKGMVVPLNRQQYFHTYEQKSFLEPLKKLNCLDDLIYITTCIVFLPMNFEDFTSFRMSTFLGLHSHIFYREFYVLFQDQSYSIRRSL